MPSEEQDEDDQLDLSYLESLASGIFEQVHPSIPANAFSFETELTLLHSVMKSQVVLGLFRPPKV